MEARLNESCQIRPKLSGGSSVANFMWQFHVGVSENRENPKMDGL